MTTLRSVALIGSLVVFGLVTASPAAADTSPPGCGADGLVVGITAPEAVHRNGDVIPLTPTYRNDTAGACDITDATLTLWLPSADATPKAGQAVTVAEHLDIPAGTRLTSLPAVDYVVALDDGVFASPATLNASGTLHDRTFGTDPAPASNQLNVVISRPHVTLTMSPDPASGLAPLPVAYTFLATNDSPVDPNAGAVQPSVRDAGVSSDTCGAVTMTGGDVDGDTLLDPGETWRYECETAFGPGTFEATATFTGSSTLDGRAWPPATARSTVTVAAPVVASASPAPSPARPPGAGSGRARHITATSVRLTGWVNPNGQQTRYRFRVHRSHHRGHLTAARKVGAGMTRRHITVTVGHLKAGTRYHYRLIATSAAGSTRGRDRHFSTRQVCVVPKLRHKTLPRAIKLLHRHHCTLGHVTRPHHRHGRLRVSHQSRLPGSRHHAHAPVNLMLRRARG